MIREDLSEKLIHLTRDFYKKSAKSGFLKILSNKYLLGTETNIEDSSKCICFSEAPISSIGRIIARKTGEIRYSPYGFMFSKEYLFKLGARPVLYQTEDEFKLLPEELKYKHVKFDLSKSKKVDWTWEREWRFKTEKLILDPKETTVIIPNRQILEELIAQYQAERREISTRVFGAFPQIEWHFIVLEDLGFTME
jgi:hypothetical protein